MKLAIVGGGVTKDKAPYSDSAYHIWSTASVGLGLPRCDVIFELHDNVFTDEQLAPFDTFLRHEKLSLPKSRTFPIKEIEKAYGKHFNGSIVMMLAFAALQGYKTIDLYGVDFSSDYEGSMRDQFYYMVGLLSAQGYGINIYPGGYLNLECKTYMYDDDELSYLRDITKRASDKVKEYEYNISSIREGLAYMRGVVDTAAKIERRY